MPIQISRRIIFLDSPSCLDYDQCWGTMKQSQDESEASLSQIPFPAENRHIDTATDI